MEGERGGGEGGLNWDLPNSQRKRPSIPIKEVSIRDTADEDRPRDAKRLNLTTAISATQSEEGTRTIKSSEPAEAVTGENRQLKR